jgi:hypothetical protein
MQRSTLPCQAVLGRVLSHEGPEIIQRPGAAGSALLRYTGMDRWFKVVIVVGICTLLLVLLMAALA